MVVSHTRTPFSTAQASVLPSGLNATLAAAAGSFVKWWRTLPVFASQMTAALSSPPLATRAPSFEQATDSTAAVCPVRVRPRGRTR